MDNGINNLREFGNFRLDPVKRVLWHEGEPVNLALKEIELLCVLTENGGEVVTKTELLDKVWKDSFVEESNLSRHVYVLRKTFKDFGESENLIKTVPRRGYRFTGEVRIPNGDVVIEKHTSTRTLIEIQEDSKDQTAAVDGIFMVRYIAAGSIIGALIIAAALFTWNYRTGPSGIPATRIESVAVLPVKSFSNRSDDEELRMRITDALITRLGSLGGIPVRPTSAILPFAGSEKSVTEIGQMLKVDAVIDSRLQEEDGRLRVTVQLVRVSDGESLWSEIFDGQANRILNLQDSIAARVSRPLIDGDATLAKAPTAEPEAFEAYLKGRYFWYKRDEASLRRAIEFFTDAVGVDPDFSEAYALLADTQHLLFNYNIEVNHEIIAKAKSNLARALELKPNSADALIALGSIRMGYDWDWAGAEDLLKRAVAAEPNNAFAHIRYGVLLVRIRRFDEAQAAFARSLDLDPLSLISRSNLGMVEFCKKDFPAAEAAIREVMELDKKAGASHWLLSRTFWQMGRHDESVQQIVLALENDGNSRLAELIRNKADSSTAEEAIRLLLHEWRMNPPGTNPHNMAYLSTYVGDRETAIRWLEKLFDEHHPWATWMSAAPEFETLYNEPGYQKLLQRMNMTY